MTDLAPGGVAFDLGVEAPLHGSEAALSIESLRSLGARPAVVDDGDEGRTISYEELAERVERRRDALGDGRRLVALAGANDVDTIVTVLAAFDGGHALMIAEPGRALDGLAGTYHPDTVVTCGRGTVEIAHPTGWDEPSAHDLHPDLALLLSTSGTTGGSKVVRLSAAAVDSNARAIAQALELSDRDRAITTLPLHYCYGLSVITSHLAAGASIVLTDNAVVDPCFWRAVERWEVTTLAGVPYTFEMIERLGRDVLRVPSMRLLTQAGGRMEPDAVRRFDELGEEAGWGFAVMYGQTEATARMAVSPPDEVRRHPTSVGCAIPGGAFRIDRACDDRDAGIGEVVYTGPNVMMGYACGSGDLARGHDLRELRTGDLGRLDRDGRLELVGRASRFVKIHGKRVDLDDIENRLSTPDCRVVCVGDDDGIVVVTESDELDRVTLDDGLYDRACAEVSIPAARVIAATIPQIPRTASGKVDGPSLVEVGRSVVPSGSTEQTDRTVAAAFELVLGLDAVDPSSTFADLGGDSFSYVEMSVRLERVLGDLPADWHLTPIAVLEQHREDGMPSSRFWTRLDTGVLIRAIAILLIVCTHMGVFRLAGGAHALLAVVGYNIARFQLTASDVPGRFRRSASTIARVAVPTTLWIGLNMLIVGGYSVGALLLVNNYTGDAARRGGRWEYWYFETFVQIMVVVALVFAIPAVRRVERRGPFVFALGVLALTLVIRFDVVQWGGEYNEMFRTHTVAGFVALGWCAQRADSTWKRLVVTVLAVVVTFGYFGQFDRELRIALMIGALIWLPTVRVPRAVVTLIAPIAAASMWIFLIHWQVWPLLTPSMHNGLAFWLTIASGVGVWWMIDRLGRFVRDSTGWKHWGSREDRSTTSLPT
ncbi:AMP-binding protein [Ilumatobacter sp.]|uniref:AMP-binding protein n=1 Tax=Ilumatobacter sp. TaxID=1967498 RepID=UPI003C4319CF